jgi:hypothetical protein
MDGLASPAWYRSWPLPGAALPPQRACQFSLLLAACAASFSVSQRTREVDYHDFAHTFRPRTWTQQDSRAAVSGQQIPQFECPCQSDLVYPNPGNSSIQLLQAELSDWRLTRPQLNICSCLKQTLRNARSAPRGHKSQPDWLQAQVHRKNCTYFATARPSSPQGSE